jgi:hypothetical protein
MKPLIIPVMALAIFLIVSCGLSQNEKSALLNAQKAKDDSIRVAAVTQVKKTDSLKSSLNESIIFYTSLLGRQQSALILNKTAIYTANDEMTQIQAFHVGRTPQEREQQVAAQELKIQSLVSLQASLQTAIQQNIDKISAFRIQLSSLKD